MLFHKFILVIVVIVVQQHVVKGLDGTCPPGAVNLSKTCYTFSSAPATFSEARFHCNEQNGTLAAIDSAFTNNHIAEIAGKNWVDFWIGAILTTFDLDDGKVRIWTWDGLDKFLNYKDWGFNEPSNKGGCAAVKTSDGTWFADDCNVKKNFVCSIPMQVDVCEPEWMYFPHTRSCYKVLYNSQWNNAENNCILLGAHLVSIHSKKENDFVQDIAQTGLQLDSDYKETYIGLYTTTNDNSIWNWTDGSPVDYLSWLSGEPNGPGVEKCVHVYTDPIPQVPAGYWNNVRCDAQLRNYVCKKHASQIEIKYV